MPPTRINRLELFGILLLGGGHAGAELAFGGRVAVFFSIAAVVLVANYCAYRIFRGGRTQLRAWGLTSSGFVSSLRFQLPFALVAVLLLFGFGVWQGNASLPPSFFLVLILYPLWGLAQQFALQNFIARNLVGVFPSNVPRAIIVAALFSISHTPYVPLMLLSFAIGIFLTLVYAKHPNLWAVGLTHGILGSLAVYLVIGIDPVLMLYPSVSR